MKARDKIASAVLLVEKKAPYFTSALAGLVRRETPGLGTLGVTSKAILMYDPEAVERWPVEGLSAVLVHEIMHWLRDHFGRGEAAAMDPKLANLAGDCEINDDLLGHWPLPGTPAPAGLTRGQMKHGEEYYPVPGTFDMPDGKTMEEYYAELRKQAEKQKKEHLKKCKACQADAKGQGQQGDGEGEKKDGEGEGCGKEGEGDGSGLGDKPQAGGGWCGSAAGRPMPGESEEKEGVGRSKVEQEITRKEVAQAIQDHVASKGRGSVPAGLSRWADSQLKPPKIPWAQKLRRAARAAVAYRGGAVDYTYRRPSRRQGAMNAAYGRNAPRMPTLHAPVPRVCIGVDTSGSMGNKEVLRAVSESRGVMMALGVPIDFLACDAEVHGGVKEVKSWRELPDRIKGGGGTSFVPAFEAVEARRPRPDVFIFCTDGCGPAPMHAPKGIAVIWVLCGKHRQRPTAVGKGGEYTNVPVTYGEVIEVDEV